METKENTKEFTETGLVPKQEFFIPKVLQSLARDRKLTVQLGEGSKLLWTARSTSRVVVAVGAVGAIFSEGRYAGFSLAMPRAQERVEEQDTFTCLTAIEGNVICGTEKGYVCVFDTTGRLWHQQRLSRSKIVDINLWMNSYEVGVLDDTGIVSVLGWPDVSHAIAERKHGLALDASPSYFSPVETLRFRCNGVAEPRALVCCDSSPRLMHSFSSNMFAQFENPTTKESTITSVLRFVVGCRKPALASYTANKVDTRPSLGSIANETADRVKGAMSHAMSKAITSFSRSWMWGMVGKAAKRTGFDDHLNRVESKMQSYYVDAGSESSDASLLAARAKEQEFLSRLPGDLYIENALFDEEREVCDVAFCTPSNLMAMADSLGRVSLIDMSTHTILRLWKGYRSASVGFHTMVEGYHAGKAMLGLYLVIFAPRKGTLDVWRCVEGPQVMSLAIGQQSCLVRGSIRGVDLIGNAKYEPRFPARPCSIGNTFPHVVVGARKSKLLGSNTEKEEGGPNDKKESEEGAEEPCDPTVFCDLVLSQKARERLNAALAP